ncbi:MAG: hypothetical protein FWB99_05490 [Treponema sp.]|nr:hypothetical protein [Treponema sp.]
MGKDDGGFLDIIGAVATGMAVIIGGAAVVAGVIFLAKITYDAIHKYLNKAKEIPGSHTAELLKQRIDSGKYNVVCNVFNRSGKKLESQAWEGKEIDSELQAEFGRKDKIVYDLTA